VSPSLLRSMPFGCPRTPAASGRRKAAFPPDTAVASAGPSVTTAAPTAFVSITRNTVSSKSPSPDKSATRSILSAWRTNVLRPTRRSPGVRPLSSDTKATARPSSLNDGASPETPKLEQEIGVEQIGGGGAVVVVKTGTGEHLHPLVSWVP